MTNGYLLAAVVFLGSMAGVALLGFPVHRLLDRFNIIDKPNERSSHAKPVARGGGLAIMAAIFAGAILMAAFSGDWTPLQMVVVALFLAAISFWDDLHSLRASIRLVCHVAAAALSLFIIGWFAIDWKNAFSLPWPLAVVGASFAGIFYITGYTNAFNFMDGINGLAGMQAVIASGGAAVLAVLSGVQATDPAVLFCLLVSGAAAGFMPHNFPRARMFMGDVGSAPLGYLLSSTLMWIASRHGWWLLIPLLAMHGNFIFDTAFTLVRRILKGEQWYAPHREHFYQRFIRAGRSHAFVTCWEAGLQCLTMALMIAYVKYSHAVWNPVFVAVFLVTWTLFFLKAEIEFKKCANAKANNSNGKLINASK